MRGAALVLVSLLLGAGPASSEEREPIRAQVEPLAVEPVLAGGAGELSLVVLEAPDRALPLAIRFDPSPLRLVDNRLDWGAVVDPLASQPRVRGRFAAPSQPGSYPVTASVEYWVCVEAWCRRKQGRVTWTVTVR